MFANVVVLYKCSNPECWIYLVVNKVEFFLTYAQEIVLEFFFSPLSDFNLTSGFLLKLIHFYVYALLYCALLRLRNE